MFARKVAVRLKPGALNEFATLMRSEILPWLRKQEGFLDLITLAVPDGSEVATITFWDHETEAQPYNTSGYPGTWRILEVLLDGIPYVKTFDVVGSTLPRLAPMQLHDADPVQDVGSTPLGIRSYETSA